MRTRADAGTSGRPGGAAGRAALPRLLALGVVLGCVAGALAVGRARLAHARRQLADVAQRYHALRLDPFDLQRFPAAAPPKPAGVRRVVLLGDSRAEDWPAPRAAGFEFANRGVAGQTSAQVLGRYAAHVTPLAPEFVVVQVGVNDLLVARALPARGRQIELRLAEHLRRLTDQATREGAVVLLTTVFPPGAPASPGGRAAPDMLRAAIARVNAAVHGMAAPRVWVIDAGRVLADGTGYVRPAYARDRLHLTPAAYEALNARLVAALAGGRGVGEARAAGAGAR